MKLEVHSLYSKLISFCLLLLGFAACDSNGEELEPIVVEYGTPSARYKVSGKVVSSDAKKSPIKNIRVVMIEDLDESKYPYLIGDTVFTDADGKFETTKYTYPMNKFNIKLQDVDGENNGLFEDKVQKVEFQDSDLKGSTGNWNRGQAEKDLGTIEMSSKPKAE